MRSGRCCRSTDLHMHFGMCSFGIEFRTPEILTQIFSGFLQYLHISAREVSIYRHGCLLLNPPNSSSINQATIRRYVIRGTDNVAKAINITAFMERQQEMKFEQLNAVEFRMLYRSVPVSYLNVYTLKY